jgi:hypothetical protein
MIFNFVLSNHSETSLNAMGDLLEPIYLGLGEVGHHVIRYSTAFQPAPAVNVLTEFFVRDGFVDEVLRLKKEGGARFVFGILCTEDPEDDLVMAPQLGLPPDYAKQNPQLAEMLAVYAHRRPNLERLLAAADFAWALLPAPGYFARHIDPARVATLEYGYCEGSADPRPVLLSALRDIDVILYGNENPYRTQVATVIRKMGFTCFATQREGFPGFVTDDVIRRAKLLLDIRRGPGVRFLSPTRIVKGLHCGTAVLSEKFDSSEIATLYGYTEACAFDELAERCAARLKTGDFVERGTEAAQRFRRQTSMRDNLSRVLKLPVFAGLAA